MTPLTPEEITDKLLSSDKWRYAVGTLNERLMILSTLREVQAGWKERCDQLERVLGYLLCEHNPNAPHRSGGNDYILCHDCGLEFDYRKETIEEAATRQARAVLPKVKP